jgi:hypothetical protein
MKDHFADPSCFRRVKKGSARGRCTTLPRPPGRESERRSVSVKTA